MPNSVESKAKQIVSGLDPENEEESFATLERAIDLFEHRADCVGCKLAKPEPRSWMSTRTIAIGALVVGLFVPPLFPLDEIIGTANAWRGPAVGVHELTLKTPSVGLGQPLIISSKSEYFKVCSWRWVHEWMRANGAPISLSWFPGAAHVIGAVTEHDWPLELPKGIQPGNYLLHISGTGDCGHGDMAQVDHKNIAFTVTN